MSGLKASCIQGMEFARPQFCVTPEAGTKFEELLDPAYWRHVRQGLRPDSILWCKPEDRAWTALLEVETLGPGGARVSVIFHQELEVKKADNSDTAGLDVKWGGPRHKWRVMRMSDKTVLKHGFQNEQDAWTWLGANAPKLAAA